MEKTKEIFAPSEKQLKILYWWMDPQARKRKALICDGAVRSGKTVFMGLSFVLWALSTYRYDENFAICGKTVTAAVRNSVNPLIKNLISLGYHAETKNGKDGLKLVVCDGVVTHGFYIFGGHDESSQRLIQGVTLAGILFDEVALMPRSFVEEGMARCSVGGSKFWFNCNPEFPKHWFNVEWVKKPQAKNALRLHFLMTDNPSLSQETLDDYDRTHTGVFHDRKVKGLWVAAEGLIYRKFADNPQGYFINSKELPPLMEVNAGFDPGGTKSKHAFVATGITRNYRQLIALKSERHETEGTMPGDLDRMAVAFVGKVIEKYGRCDYLYWDNEAAVLGRGIKKAVESAYPQVSVRPCYKGTINDRIHLTCLLLGADRFRYTEDCASLKEALEQAVWNEKEDDVRLDDFTTPIDDLDAFEYTFSPQMGNFIF